MFAWGVRVPRLLRPCSKVQNSKTPGTVSRWFTGSLSANRRVLNFSIVQQPQRGSLR